MSRATKTGSTARRGFIKTAAVLASAPMLAADDAPGSAVPEWEQRFGSIADVRGIRVGHYTHPRRPTGCTVILFDEPAVAGVDVRGSAPGTRETDLLNPINLVQHVNAIVLSGGSAYGLDAASGVMRFLEERNVGFHAGSVRVPIVPAAILFDLQIGDPKIHPNADSGFAACQAAVCSNIPEGSVGAGAGASVGKFFGFDLAMKSGIGTASWTVPERKLAVGAIVAVNAAGDVISRHSGKILAGARNPNGPGFLNSMDQFMKGAIGPPRLGSSTTIGVIATNAALSKVEVTKVAQMAHDGLARTINPVHTLADGDTLFAAATGSSRQKHDVNLIGAIAAEVVAHAVNRAVITAAGIEGYPAYRDFTVHGR